MKHCLNFSAFLLLVLVLQSSGRNCGPEEYGSQDGLKCCRKCEPGTRLIDRCTKDTDTVCKPCEKGWYNSFYTTWECEICTFCNPDEGFREEEECRSTSDTVCVCLPGYKTVKYEPNKKRCDPCPPGHFSKSGDMECTPWTNCTAKGRNTLRFGTKEEDAVCGNPPAVSHATELPIKHSPEPKMARATSVTKPTFKPTMALHTYIAMSTKELPSGVQKSSYLSYILIAAALLLVSGGIILLKVFWKTKTYKEPGRFAQQMQKDGKNSFRIPIQEEQIDTKSSLVQN